MMLKKSFLDFFQRRFAKGVTFAALPKSSAYQRVISPGDPSPGLAGCFSTAS
jgi:hypothetical protein